MLKYTLLSPLIQNILENISLPPERSLNYIPLPSYFKIYALLPQFYFISNNQAKKIVQHTLNKNSIKGSF